MRKGTAKLGWVPTAGLHEQSGLNCTGCGPSAAGRATTGPMVSQRSVCRKPLCLTFNLQRSAGTGGNCGPNWLGLRFWAGGRAGLRSVKTTPLAGLHPAPSGVEHATYGSEG